MNTATFISALRKHKDKKLFFKGDIEIEPGYHVTEIKAKHVKSMDCGGQEDAWYETAIQVWLPENTEDRSYMTVQKFLSIYDRVAQGLVLEDEAEVFIEYAAKAEPAINYLVEDVAVVEERVSIQLQHPLTTCKAADRLNQLSVINDQDCCAPANAADTCCA